MIPKDAPERLAQSLRRGRSDCLDYQPEYEIVGRYPSVYLATDQSLARESVVWLDAGRPQGQDQTAGLGTGLPGS